MASGERPTLGRGKTRGVGGANWRPRDQLAGTAQLQPNFMKKHAPKPPECLILKAARNPLFVFPHGKPDGLLNVGS